RAISRTPTLPLRSRMKATSSSREGRRVEGACLMGGSPANPARGAVREDYSAACVVLRGLCAARFGALPLGRFDGALICLAVPGDGRLVRRGRARGAGALRAARASISATASSGVTVSGVLSAGSVALTPL